MHEIIQKVLHIVEQQLNLLGVNQVTNVVLTNHCWKDDIYLLSAHVIYPDVQFETNTIDMKYFIQKMVNPQLMKDIHLLWDKNVQAGTGIKNCG